MDPNRVLNIWALANACQRLSDLARELSKSRQPLGAGELKQVGSLVMTATQLLEHQDTGASPVASQRPKRSGFFARVLGGGDERLDVPGVMENEPKPPSANHTLALRGHDQLIPTPDLVGFLSSQKKTGLLEVVTEVELFTLEFDSGDIVHAHSNRTPEGQRLGDILVTRGAIERTTLEQVLRTSGSGRLGETLVALDFITQEKFLDALRLQIHWLFQRLFEQPSTRFVFWSGPPMYAESNVRLNATALLLDGARAFDETHWMGRLSADGTTPIEPPLPSPAEPVESASVTQPGPDQGDWLDVSSR